MTAISPNLPVLVAGATGFVGGKVVNELLNCGNSERALVRSTTDANRVSRSPAATCSTSTRSSPRNRT